MPGLIFIRNLEFGDRPKPQIPNLTLFTERYREKFTPERSPARMEARPTGSTGVRRSSWATLAARPVDSLQHRSAVQAAIPLALAFAASIAVISSSWSKLQNR